MSAVVQHTPGPWSVGYRGLDIQCVNAKIGGSAKLFDVRGWGYLTGTGHGALGLSEDEAVAIQAANASVAAAAPDMLAALKAILANDGAAGSDQYHAIKWGDAREAGFAAIAKAEGRAA